MGEILEPEFRADLDPELCYDILVRYLGEQNVDRISFATLTAFLRFLYQQFQGVWTLLASVPCFCCSLLFAAHFVLAFATSLDLS